MHTLTIAERPDLTYNILINDTLEHEQVEQNHLKRYCARYGVSDERFDQLMRAVAIPGKATIEIPDGKFEQG